ncbi:diacylglycerol/lipid kinase family protein [Subtercola vilae]|uniref:Diacylglycerol kinase n=1 Tax=Subtercola vilae TaxID=2056433 RepID=A0A4T2C8U1_9MICO|nr:diacylglycerol kinase family protein [Subtercola vilae]TIH39046.1 diacylglycerol kinase [Subtercola vilae]
MTPPALPRPRAAIVYNPTKVDVRRLRSLVESVEAELSWGPSFWAATTVDDAGEGQALRLLQASPDVVIAAGGDGTVSAVAQALRHQQVPLGILPVGTTNLFARALGLPLGSPRRALLAAFSDELRTVDVGRVDALLQGGETVSAAFLVMTGMGVDAQMVANTSSRGKSAFGWVGYIAAIVQSFTRNRQFGLSYTLDGGRAAVGTAHTLVIGNAGVLPAGIRMIPGALIDDGELDVVLLRPRGARGWHAAIGWFVRTNTAALPRRADARAAATGAEPVMGEFVQHSRAASVSVSVDAPQDFEIDGEYVGRAVSLEAWIEAEALTVRGSVADLRSVARRNGEIASRSQLLTEMLVTAWRRLVPPPHGPA